MPIPGLASVAVPYGSVVVVSGVTGFIGSHIADQLLLAGYKVRGTTRNVQTGKWAEEHFRGKYGHDSFELKQVIDMAADGAFDTVVDGKHVFACSLRGFSSSPEAIRRQGLHTRRK
jgi:nucleoside-diphosphate-sugar epimerase